MSGTYREHVDSREAFTADEEAAYHADTVSHEEEDWAEMDAHQDHTIYCHECDEALDECTCGDEEEYDGQPTEYEEWQDLYGGDDWDHGQYDEY